MTPDTQVHAFRTLLGLPPEKGDAPACGANLTEAYDFAPGRASGVPGLPGPGRGGPVMSKPNADYGVRYGTRGWEAYGTPRGTMTRDEAVAKAERKNAADIARRSRFAKGPAQIDKALQ